MRTTSDELPEERVFDILCTNETSHSIENPPCGWITAHSTKHLWAIVMSPTANPKPTSTVATLETTPCVGTLGPNCGGGPTRQQHNNDKLVPRMVG